MPKTNTVEAGERTQHTPGDWQVRDDGTNAQIISPAAGNFAIALVYSGGSKYPGNHEQRANARLIAAAPTMYSFVASRADSGDAEAMQIIKEIQNASR